MKIVHVILSLDPAAGGPPQVAVRLAAAQVMLGHDIHLISYAPMGGEERVQRQIASVPGHTRIKFHTLPPPNRLERTLARRARTAFDDLYAGVDFVHIHGIWGTLLRVAALVARRRNIPYCFRPAGMLDPWSLAQKRWKKRIALAMGYRAALRGAAFIHTLNVDERQLIEPLALGVPSVVLPNGVFIEEIEPLPPPGSFRAAHQELGVFPFVLFLSRLHFKKGLDVLGEAFSLLAQRHPETHLVVAGPDDGARDTFARQVTGAGLGDRVHLIGPLYGPDKFAAMVDAACFCLPSRQEGFSVAITEAMACGTPVVISESCHFPEVASAGAGVVVPLDAARLATALERVLVDRTLASRMGAAGAALVRARYTWGAIATQSIEIYRRGRQESAAKPGEVV